ncbi:PA3496 family putative envelope integrity protein [Thalassotalea maritima]|uniref:PA3496 family putative envelope integrity protein n=1 Tax=Thalassotalea maritima TaxID=3242416 RepID=UPI003527C2D5
MSRNKIIDDVDFSGSDEDFDDDVSANTDDEKGNQESAKTRRRIDELLERKRLKELLDEDEWEL